MHAARTAALATTLLTAGAITACEADPTGPRLPEPGDRIIVAFDQSLDPWPRDAWDLVDANVIDDYLELATEYGGGCRTHQLWLLAVDGWERLPDAGVTPTAAVPILLAHEANDDPCEALIRRTERFDLAPLRAEFTEFFDTTTGRIILRIPTGQGSPDTVSVDFVLD